MKRYLFISILLIFASETFSQGFYNSRLWQKQRHEYSFFIGASNFLGELGGRDQVGTNFLLDLEFNQTKMVGGVSYQYYLAEKHAINIQGTFGRVSGHDNTTTEIFRQNRNLHFRSNIYEASFNYQFHFITAKQGNVYNLKSGRGKKLGLKSLGLGMYATLGVGGFYFNPQAERISGSGVWTDLAPLGTEGQGVDPDIDYYKRVSIAIPVGFGIRYNLGREWGLKLELSHRFTFTDYIDDVSTNYYDPSELSAVHGPESAHFSNPTINSIPSYMDGTYEYNPTKPGAQRGDPTDRDGYLYAVLGVYYRPKSTSRGRYKGGKGKRRIRASY